MEKMARWVWVGLALSLGCAVPAARVVLPRSDRSSCKHGYHSAISDFYEGGLPEYEFLCSIDETQKYKTNIVPNTYYNLDCHSIEAMDVRDIPTPPTPLARYVAGLHLYFCVAGCPLPPSSYAALAAHLGVRSVPRLIIQNIAHGASVQRQHLGGLRELGVSSLDLTRSGITTLPDDLFQDSEHLTELVLNDNRLVLEGKEFRSLRNLQVLEMSGCELMELPAGLLALPALRTLVLEDNSGLELRGATFSGLPALEDLRLVRNSLRTLPPDVFHNLPSLTTIDLSRNKLTELSAALFAHNKRLRYIKMDKDGLEASNLVEDTEINDL